MLPQEKKQSLQSVCVIEFVLSLKIKVIVLRMTSSLFFQFFTQVLPIPKPRAVDMTEEELKISERSVRRHAQKQAEEAIKAEEKAKKIAEKKAKDPKYKSKKDSEKDSETEEKEAIVEKVECFGEELQPDFSVKKVKRL